MWRGLALSLTERDRASCRRSPQLETVHTFQAEESWEAGGGLGAHAGEGLPGAPRDVVGEASDGAGAEAQGAGSASVHMLAV
jgi:hypothetical protein